jgi:signal transduction histidine kinase
MNHKDRVNILLVDDQPGRLLSHEAILSSLGENLVQARSGTEALQRILQQEFAVILMDVNMPGMDGFEVAALMRQHPRFEQTPIIFVTAVHVTDLDRLQGYKVGAVDYVYLPVVPEILRSKVAVLVELYRKRRELEHLNRTLEEANAELALANQLKDEFLATMSHELRTPLTAVLGQAEVLKEQLHGPLTAGQLDSVRSIQESGKHLLALINDVLDLAKIGAGRMELKSEPVDVEALCRASMQLVRAQAQKKQQRVALSLDSQVGVLRGDERRLTQILVNLLSNAVKFTPPGGAIGLDVTGDVSRREVRFTVWDTGVGIAQEDLPRLCQPFVQLGGGLARQHEGTGLGLALVARLVELHGGRVEVASEVGRGSRVTVSLPWQQVISDDADSATPQEETVNVRNTPAADEKRGPVVLVAEDNEGIAKLYSTVLGANGYQVVLARDGLEALARAEQETPDVILMDLRMPVMDGLETTRRLRAADGLSHIPIVAVTGQAMPDDRSRCLDAGVNAYLSKPFSLQDLLALVEAQLEPRGDAEETADQEELGGGLQRPHFKIQVPA